MDFFTSTGALSEAGSLLETESEDLLDGTLWMLEYNCMAFQRNKMCLKAVFLTQHAYRTKHCQPTGGITAC
jgi:hypothetical protein